MTSRIKAISKRGHGMHCLGACFDYIGAMRFPRGSRQSDLLHYNDILTGTTLAVRDGHGAELARTMAESREAWVAKGWRLPEEQRPCNPSRGGIMVNGIEITACRVTLPGELDDPKVLGYASIQFNKALRVDSLKIIQGKSRAFVAMPSRRNRDGNHYNVVFPVVQELRDLVERTVMDEYAKVSGID